MCGIVGVIRFDGESLDPKAIRDLNASIAHRGPDDDGIFVDGPVGLAMRRLSIIDLDTGHQPMWSADGRFVIVFNGEVYNYREIRDALVSSGRTFRTRSDTEVVLEGYQEWGPAVLERMLGMWGLAIYDTTKRELFLARDRLGKKQIYYALTPEFLVFGSEMAVAMRYSSQLRRLNRSVVAEFLRHGYLGSGRMAAEGVADLPAAHWAIVDERGEMTLNEYWSIHRGSSEAPPSSEAEAAERCYSLIVDAVRYRLVADVPISVMLSSGLDSSTLAYVLAKELAVPLHAFTLGFDDAGFDESRDAGKFATDLGLPWHREFISGCDVAADFPAMIGHMSSLQSNTAQVLYFYVSRMIRAAGYKVALNGSGGDELFAGYPTYRATRLFEYYRRAPAAVRKGIHQLAKKLPASLGRVSFDYQVKKFTEFTGASTAAAHGYWRTMFSPTELRAVMREDAFPDVSSHSALYEDAVSSFADLERMTVTDLLKSDMLAWLQPMLPWTDNMSMAHGVELRLPMLDHRLVEFAYSLPEAFLFRGWKLKRVMKLMLARRVPRDVVVRRKRGTHLPIGRWLNAELAAIADAYLSSSAVRAGRLFDEVEVARLVSRHRSGEQDNTFKLWNLIIFNAWLAHHGVSSG